MSKAEFKKIAKNDWDIELDARQSFKKMLNEFVDTLLKDRHIRIDDEEIFVDQLETEEKEDDDFSIDVPVPPQELEAGQFSEGRRDVGPLVLPNQTVKVLSKRKGNWLQRLLGLDSILIRLESLEKEDD